MSGWISAQQQAVNKIRSVMGNNDNIVLSAGTDWTHAGNWVNLNTNTGLVSIKNPSGDYKNLLFSVHD